MSKTNIVYNVEDKPSWGKTIVFALQHLLAILAATIAVPAIIGHGMSASAALFGAGIGTLVYLIFTKFKSPVFLGSSFAFIGSISIILLKSFIASFTFPILSRLIALLYNACVLFGSIFNIFV